MTPTITLTILAGGIARCILAIVEIAVLLAVFPGIPGASTYFTWFVQRHLLPAMDGDVDIYNAREAVIYCFIMTIYSTVVICGALPYYSIREELPIQVRSCLSGAFFIFSTALAVISLRLLFPLRLYWLRFAHEDLWYLAKHCQLMTVFISTILGVDAGLVVTFISYTIIFGYPITVSSTLQQMKRDTREVLRRVGFGAAIGESNEEKL